MKNKTRMIIIITLIGLFVIGGFYMGKQKDKKVFEQLTLGSSETEVIDKLGKPHRDYTDKQQIIKEVVRYSLATPHQGAKPPATKGLKYEELADALTEKENLAVFKYYFTDDLSVLVLILSDDQLIYAYHGDDVLFK